MGRPVGLPKTGGRKAGTPNKTSRHMIQLLESLEFNVIEQIINDMPDLKPSERVKTCLALLPFVYPKKAPEQFDTIDPFF